MNLSDPSFMLVGLPSDILQAKTQKTSEKRWTHASSKHGRI